MATPDDLLRSQHELRAALRTAISEIERLNFGRKDSAKLRQLRRVLAEARAVTAAVSPTASEQAPGESDAC